MKSLSHTVLLNLENTVWDGASLERSAFYMLEAASGFNLGFLVRRFHPLITVVQNPWGRSCPVQKYRSGRGLLMWSRP
jgi:hypothetical protein